MYPNPTGSLLPFCITLKFAHSLQFILRGRPELIKFHPQVSILARITTFKALIQTAYLALVASWLAFVVIIFMAHENGENKGQQRDTAGKEC